MPKSNLLTASRLRAYRDCARKHSLLYEHGYRPVQDAEVLRFGTLIHTGLEAWWNAVQQSESNTLGAALAAVAGEASDAVDLVKAEEILRGYDNRWKLDIELYEVLAVEPRFEAPMLNPQTLAASRTWVLAGGIDSILRHRSSGRTLVREFKTTSEAIDSDADLYWQRLSMDAQLSIYVIGAESLGYQIDECLYDVVRKPLLRISEIPITDEEGVKVVHDANGERVRTKDGKKWRQTGDSDAGYLLQTRPETPEEFRLRLRDEIASNPDKYYQRKPIPRMNSQVQDFMFDAWQLGQQIREAELAGRSPRNPEACLRYGSKCAFFDACANGLDLSTSPDFRRLDDVHPELRRQEVANVAH